MIRLGDSTLPAPAALAILCEKVERLFEQLHLPVFRYMMCKARNSCMAEDITLESFLRHRFAQAALLTNPQANR